MAASSTTTADEVTPPSSAAHWVIRSSGRRPVTKRRKLHRRLLMLSLLLGIPMLVAALLFLDLSLLLDSERLRDRLRAELGARLAVPFDIEEVSFELFDGLTIKGLKLGSPPGCNPEAPVRVAELRLEPRIVHLLQGRLTIDGIHVDGLDIRLERDSSNNLNLFHLLDESPDAGPTPEFELPQVIIKNLVVHVDESIAKIDEPLRVPLLTLDLPKDRGGDAVIEGTLLHPEVRRISISGNLNAARQSFVGKIQAVRVQFDDRLRMRLPDSLRTLYDEFQPHGLANIGFDIEFKDGHLEKWGATLEIIGGSLHSNHLPVPIESVSGMVTFAPGVVTITRPLTGRAGQGDAYLGGELHLEGSEVTQSSITFSLDEIPLGPDTRRLLAREVGDDLVTLLDELGPKGNLKLTYRGSGAGFPPEINELDLELQGISLTPRAFPYTLRNLTGTIHIRDDHFEIVNVTGGTDAMPIRIWGHAPFAKTGELDIHVQIDALPLNRQVERALAGSSRSVWQEFHPEGTVDVEVWMHRSSLESGPPQQTIVIKGRDTSISYHLFPYKIGGLQGEVRITKNQVFFSRLTGNHGSSRINLERGSLRFDEDGVTEYDFQIHSPNLLIDSDLIRALPTDAQLTLNDFEPRGQLDTTFDISNIPAQPLMRVRAIIDPDHPCKIRYAAFPYELNVIRGETIVDIRSDVIDFNKFETDPNAGPRVLFSGNFSPSEESPEKKELFLDLGIYAGQENGQDIPGLVINDKLLRSLPVDLRNFVESLKIEGAVTGGLTATYRYKPGVDAANRQQEVHYQGELSAFNGGIDFGLKFTDIKARLGFEGQSTPNTEHRFSGTAEIAQFTFSKFKLRDTKLSYYYGSPHEAIRDAIDGKQASKRFVLRDPFLTRLRDQQNARKALQVYVQSSRLYEGNVEGFLYIDVGARRDFHGELISYGVDLETGSRDIFGDEGASGVASGTVLFGGNTADTNALYGRGNVDIRDGKLKKLPAIARILSPFGDYTKPQYIDSLSLSKFVIKPGRFEVENWDDMVLRSDRLKILAKGSLDFDQNLVLYLDPEPLETEIPIVDIILFPLNLIPYQRFKIEGPLEDPGQPVPIPY